MGVRLWHNLGLSSRLQLSYPPWAKTVSSHGNTCFSLSLQKKERKGGACQSVPVRKRTQERAEQTRKNVRIFQLSFSELVASNSPNTNPTPNTVFLRMNEIRTSRSHDNLSKRHILRARLFSLFTPQNLIEETTRSCCKTVVLSRARVVRQNTQTSIWACEG